MILTYLDESGDTGTNLTDIQQPIFVLGSLLIQQEKWKPCEKKFWDIVSDFFDGSIPSNFELHTMDLVNRNKWFKGYSLEKTKQFRDNLIDLIINEKLEIIYRKIIKNNYHKYCEEMYGKGIKIEPYIMAFPFICLAVEEKLKDSNELGILIFDEHRNFKDIEQSLKVLRGSNSGKIGTELIIEKGFSIDSSKSYPIQLLDLYLYYIRKFQEHKIGKKVSQHHQETFNKIISFANNTDNLDKSIEILEWVNERTKKK